MKLYENEEVRKIIENAKGYGDPFGEINQLGLSISFRFWGDKSTHEERDEIENELSYLISELTRQAEEMVSQIMTKPYKFKINESTSTIYPI